MKRKNLLIVALLMGLFLVIPIIILSEQRISAPTIEIVEGDDVDAPEDLRISQSSFEPTSTVTVLNYSSVESKTGWYIFPNVAYTQFAISLGNISAIILGISFTTYNQPVHLSLSKFPYEIENSTTVEPNQISQLILRTPYDPSYDFSNDDIFTTVEVSIRLEDCSWNDFDITCFWADVITVDTLYPVTLDVQRTNGESLYSNPNMRILDPSFSPRIYFNSSSVGFRDYLLLRRVNETILLPEGSYFVSLRWNTDLNGTLLISNTSTVLIWSVKCVRVDMKLTQDIPGFYVYFSGYSYYEQHMLLYSPSFYFRSEIGVSVEIKSDSNAFQDYFYASTYIVAGQNQNITVMVNPGWISIGDISITPGRIVIIGASLLLIAAIIIFSRTKLLTSARIIPFLILFIGILLPWLQVSQIETFPAPTPPGEYQEVWSISPAIFTSFANQDNFSLAIAPSDIPHLGIMNLGIGAFVFLLVSMLFIGITSEITNAPQIPSIKDEYFAILYTLILVLELSFLIQGHDAFTRGWIDSFALGIGSLFPILSVVVWMVIVFGSNLRKSNPTSD